MNSRIFRRLVRCMVICMPACAGMAQKEVWSNGSFWDNMYVSEGVGVGLRISPNGAKNSTWSEQSSLQYGFAAGKRISRFVALQASYRHGKIRQYGWKYNILSADMLVDVTSLHRGYRPDRKWRIVPFLGIGGTFGRIDKKQAMDFTYGVQTLYRINDRLDMKLSLRGDVFGNFVLPQNVRGGTNLLGLQIGLNYNIGGGKFEKAYTGGDMRREIDSLNAEVNIMRKQLDMLLGNSMNEQAVAAKDDSLKKVYYTEPNDNKLYIHIRFSEFSSYLSEKERANIQNIGSWMKEHHDFSIKIAAFSDNLSDKEFDNKLREKRSEAIRQILISQYNIAEDRIMITTPEKEGYVNKTDCSAMIVFIPGK